VLLFPERLPAASTAHTVYVYVRSGHSREKVSVVCDWGTATVWLLMALSLTRYEKLPELSVDAFQASEMLVSVVAVIRRFVGVVGGVRSGRVAPAVLAPKATMSRIAPTARPRVPESHRLLPSKGSRARVLRQVRSIALSGLAAEPLGYSARTNWRREFPHLMEHARQHVAGRTAYR
jgi:hypothetical protein